MALGPDERIEIARSSAATREQFLANWDGRIERIERGLYLD